VLVVAGFPGAAAVFKGDSGEAVSLEVFLAEGEVPEFFGGGVLGDVGFGSGLPVDLVDAASVGGVGEAGFEFFGVVFGLGDALGVGEVSFFGFNDSEFFAFVVGVFGGGAFAVAEEAIGAMTSRRILLCSTVPQPEALRAGSMSSARVSASFMGRSTQYIERLRCVYCNGLH